MLYLILLKIKILSSVYYFFITLSKYIVKFLFHIHNIYKHFTFYVNQLYRTFYIKHSKNPKFSVYQF